MRSMPISATCTRGSDVVSRPLPSLVVMQTLPVAATPKLPPEMPMSACRNPLRSTRRASAAMRGASATSSSVACSLRAEEPRDIVPALVDDRHHDVRGMVVVELHDVLAQVGFEHLDAGARQAGVELDLLADHRLALHDGLDAVLARDVDDDGDGFLGSGGPMDVSAATLDVGLELAEVVVEPRDGVRADGARVVAHDVHLRERRHRGVAAGRHAEGRIADRGLQRGAADGLVDAFVEGRPERGGCSLRHAPSAEHFGQVLHLHGAALPMQPAGDVHQAAHVGGHQRVGAARPRCWRSCDRAGSRTPRCSFTANRPPKPQHVSASGSGQRGGPSTFSSSASGCRATPRPAQAVAGRDDT